MHKGSCACGAVKFEVSMEMTKVTFCHCSKCRRWHGHVGAYTAVDRAGFRLVDQRALKWWTAAPGVRRGFCGECGASLLWDEDGETKMSICAGALDAPTGLIPKAHIYVGSKGDYYPLPEDGLLQLQELK
jgi:hypothetical protein